MQLINIIGKLANVFDRGRRAYLAKKAIIRSEELPFSLRHLLGKPAGSKFLDLGCGVGEVSIVAAKCGFEVYALEIDKSQLFYERDRKVNLGISLVIAEGGRLPFRKRSFDVIYCCHVLEHIADDSSVFYDMHRALKDDGLLLLSLPNIFNLSSEFKRKLKCKHPFISREHLREYKKDDLIVLLNNYGFHILGLKMTGFLLPIGNIILNFAVLQFGLQKIKNCLAERFPESSESIDVIAAKNGWHEEEFKLQQWEQVFPLPWWLK